MAAEFGDASVVQDEDAVGVANVGEPVSDQDCGLVALPAADGLEQGVFGAGGERRGRLVHIRHVRAGDHAQGYARTGTGAARGDQRR